MVYHLLVCASQSLFVSPKALVLVSLQLVCHAIVCYSFIHKIHNTGGKSLNLRGHFGHDYVCVCTGQECLPRIDPLLFGEAVLMSGTLCQRERVLKYVHRCQYSVIRGGRNCHMPSGVA